MRPQQFQRRIPTPAVALAICFSLIWARTNSGWAKPEAIFRAGAYAMDVTPTNFPVIINGGFFAYSAEGASDQLHARCLVLDDGSTRVGLCVLDSCLIPRSLADEAKRLIQQATGLAPERVMISATHTHFAPSLMAVHGADADPDYPNFLLPRLVEGFRRAVSNLAPAQVGWAVVPAPDYTHTRVWIRRPDRIDANPFGDRTVRANMHPGHQSPDVIAPSGPSDPDLSLLAVRALDGRPLAVLANYSMHYHGGTKAVSADYYGRFADRLGQLLGATNGEPPFVGMMSQGTSGDQQWMDYSRPAANTSIDEYADALARLARAGYQNIQWRPWAEVVMRDKDLPLPSRQPSEKRLAWAREVVERFQGRAPRSLGEVYAREQIWLHDHPILPVKLQALRLGDLGIVMCSAEVFAISGLKIKGQSPLPHTFFIELANGEDGYIPPPEHHRLGSYNTWACRSAGLEVEAETKIVENLLSLLEQVSGKPRRKIVETHGAYPRAILASHPAAYWRMNEFSGQRVSDASGHGRVATSEDGVVFYLDGPASPAFSGLNTVNRAFHFAGGRMQAPAKGLGETYSVEFWFWNGLPVSARGVTGYLFSRGTDGVFGAPGEHLAIGGTRAAPGRLIFANGGSDVSAALEGRTEIAAKTWHHVALIRDGKRITAYLDGDPIPEILGELDPGVRSSSDHLFLGGRSDKTSSLEGKLDEVAVYERALAPDEVVAHYRSAALPPPPLATPVSAAPQWKGSRAIAALNPLAYWLAPAADGQVPRQEMGSIGAIAEEGVTLPPPEQSAARFSGGRLRATLPALGTNFSVTFWFFNELPNTERLITAYLFSRGEDGARGAPGDHLGLGGTAGQPGRLLWFNGNEINGVITGPTVIPPQTWNQVVAVRAGRSVKVFLNGQSQPEISGELEPGHAPGVAQIFFGGRSDNFANLRGKLADVALFNRALSPDEIARIQSSVRPGGGAGQSRADLRPAVPPRSPAESLAAWHVRDGFEVELVASEPLTMDPVALDWAPDGKLWVAEMADYPLGMDGKGRAGGRVRFLEDTDGDGRYDKSTLFLEGVNFPTGLLTWRKGVLVTAAPEIFYAEDADGDGQAETRRTLYSGFNEGNTQLRVNGLRWGLDNWIYCAASWSGGTAESAASGTKFSLGGRDLRLRPDQGLLDAQAGVTQFGRNRNDWGDWFGVNNSYPIWHFPLPDQYTRRNPFLAAADPIIQLAGQNPRIYPAKPPEKRYHSFEQAGRFTSACSTMIYRDTLLFGGAAAGEEHVFVCEPFHNLVHHEILTEDGVTFKAARPAEEQQSEFLASEDRWSRPVMALTGPDGALWVVDMYRYMIEHPEFLPPEGKAELLPFYRLGEDRGRIYRIYPKGQKPRPIPNLSRRSTTELAAALDSGNGWQRDKAQQMLVWRQDKSAKAPLARLAAGSKDPRVRLQALCTLDGLGALEPRFIEKALRDSHPGVRRQAVRLAESFLESAPALLDGLSALAADPDAKVRQQVAFSLGTSSSAKAGDALARVLLADAGDRYLRAAVLSSSTNHCPALVKAAVNAPDAVFDAVADSLASVAMGLQQGDAVAALMGRATQVPKDGFNAADFERFSKLFERIEQSGGNYALSNKLAAASFFAAARRQANDAGQSSKNRAAAVSLLGREAGQTTNDFGLLAALLEPQSPIDVQRAAIKALGRTGQAMVPEIYFRPWAGYSPEVRQAALDQLLGREPWIVQFLEQVQKGAINDPGLDVPRRERLVKHSSERIRQLAQAALGSVADADRQRVVDEYRGALSLNGEAGRGAALFTRLCATCHKMDEVGREIGPNLRSVSGHAPDKLLISILDPSREVEPRFIAYACTLSNDEEVYGIIATESGDSLTMKLLDGSTRGVLRREIKTLRSSRLSLMPAGLETGMKQQDMADLIAFLRAPPLGNAAAPQAQRN